MSRSLAYKGGLDGVIAKLVVIILTFAEEIADHVMMMLHGGLPPPTIVASLPSDEDFGR